MGKSRFKSPLHWKKVAFYLEIMRKDPCLTPSKINTKQIKNTNIKEKYENFQKKYTVNIILMSLE